MPNETITEAPKDCDDSGTIWETGTTYIRVDIIILFLTSLSCIIILVQIPMTHTYLFYRIYHSLCGCCPSYDDSFSISFGNK